MDTPDKKDKSANRQIRDNRQTRQILKLTNRQTDELDYLDKSSYRQRRKQTNTQIDTLDNLDKSPTGQHRQIDTTKKWTHRHVGKYANRPVDVYIIYYRQNNNIDK